MKLELLEITKDMTIEEFAIKIKYAHILNHEEPFTYSDYKKFISNMTA